MTKLYIYITKAEEFLAGNLSFSLRLTDHTTEEHDYLKEYIFLGEVEVDIDVDNQTLMQAATAQIDREAEEALGIFQHAMDILETRKANLLSLEHQK